MEYCSHRPAAPLEYGSHPPAAPMQCGSPPPLPPCSMAATPLLTPWSMAEYSFPRLKETTRDRMSDFLPKLRVMGMLLSGLLFFRAGLSCMLAPLGMLFFLLHFRQRQFLPDSLRSLNAYHYKGLAVADTGHVFLFTNVSCCAFALQLLQRSLLHQSHGYRTLLLLQTTFCIA